MGKPWARIEIGYLSHPKFLALNANAICLWHEGKNYCDMHHTDGLIPKDALKTFRFSGGKAIGLLMKSCGDKTDGTTYAPLWEPHAVGYKMHDYLDHNDCRETIMARMGQAVERRAVERERKAQWRAVREMSRGTNEGTVSSPSRSTTASETPTVQRKPPSGGFPRAPIHDRSHREHAVCGRVCLHASLFGDFVRRRNHDNADREIREWASRVIDDWTDGAHAGDEPGDSFDFWKARYSEKWPAAVSQQVKSLPAWARK